MPLYIGSAEFDDTSARRKAVALFAYPSTSVDLTDGMVVEAVLATTTYGAGKSLQQGSAACAYSVGCVDQAVDASEYANQGCGTARLIKVVVAGVKVDALGGGSVSQGVFVVGGASGTAVNGTVASNSAYGFGVALEDDAPAFDCLIYPRWLV